MTVSHTISRSFNRTGETLSRSLTISSGAENNLDETIPPSSTDLAVAWAAVVAKIKSFFLTCDAACTVETNSSSSPGKTFTLAAGQVISWQTGDPTAAATFFGADITSLFVTCADGGELILRALVDPT